MKKSRLDAVKRFFVPRSLRYQLLNRSLLVLAALLLLIGILQYVIMKDFIYKNKAEALNAQVMSMPKDWFTGEREGYGSDIVPNGGYNEQEPDNRPPSKPRDSPILYQPGLSLVVIELNGDVNVLSKDTDTSPPILSAEQYEQIRNELTRRKQIYYKVVKDAEGTEQLAVYRLVGPPHKDCLVQVSTDTDSLHQLLMTQLAIFTALSIAALAAGLAFYLPLLRRTLKPLSRVVKAAQRTDAGNLTERLPSTQGQEEIDRLSDAFNGMLGRLDASFEAERKTTEKMRRFVADASHELRTPLTSIHGFLEVLLRGAAANPDQLYRALNSMQLESKRINKLVEDLLALAKLDQDPQLYLSDTSLDKLLLEMEPQLHMLAGSRTVQLDLSRSVSGSYHADKLKQVILNLFLNAVQHTDSGAGVIKVTLGVKDNQAKLTVSDNGTGIQSEHLPHLFERFYRSESSRTRKTGGAGLGLSITKSIVDAHMGTIDVKSKPGEGTTFRVLLPCYPD